MQKMRFTIGSDYPECQKRKGNYEKENGSGECMFDGRAGTL